MDHRPKCKIFNYKLTEDKIGENLDNIGYGDNFIDTIPKAQPKKERILNWSSFKRMRRETTNWEKVFAKNTSDIGLLPKIYRVLKS